MYMHNKRKKVFEDRIAWKDRAIDKNEKGILVSRSGWITSRRTVLTSNALGTRFKSFSNRPQTNRGGCNEAK